MKYNSNDTRIIWLRKSIILFLLIGIFASFNLWTTDRVFPLLPVLDNFSVPCYPFDYAFIFLLIIMLGITFFNWNNRINLFVILILFILFIQDQNRWQPWAYIYFIFLILFSCQLKNPNQNSLFHFRIIIIGVYFWSGIHKLNANFINGTIESILTELFWFQNQQVIDNLRPLGYFIPIIEIAISIFLFFPKLRIIGFYLVAISHLFILVYLSPLGVYDNFIVYPWNVAMIVIVFLLFYHTKDKFDLIEIRKPSFITVLLLFFIYIFPSLNFFGLWDNYLSFNLYSNKTNNYYIAIEENQLDKLDRRLDQYYIPIEGMEGGKIIDIGIWSSKELNVPFYPERRAFKKVAKQFCKFGIEDSQLYFLELDPSSKGQYIRYTCNDF